MESNTDKAGLRVRAVLALLRGQPAAEVSAELGVCRRDLYKFRKRALAAMHKALRDKKRGPVAPHNTLEAEKEAAVNTSVNDTRRQSYEVKEKPMGDPSARIPKDAPGSTCRA
jgi:hypothetical protein